MTTYEPGTVAVATFLDGEPFRVTRYGHGWARLTDVDDFWNDGDDESLTILRPLVVLDLDRIEHMPRTLRRLADREQSEDDKPGRLLVATADLRALADQIEAQTKPPRIPEPGLWGVVEATVATLPRRRWIHHEEGRWVCDTGAWRYWQDLTDPVLIREGVES